MKFLFKILIFSGIISCALMQSPPVQAQDDPLKAFLERVQKNRGEQGEQAPQAPQAPSPPARTGGPALPDVDAAPRSPGMDLQSAPAQNNQPPGMPRAPQAAPDSQREIQSRIRQQAFDAAITGLLPLQPDEIRQLMEAYDKTQQAVSIPIYPYPEPEIAVETISLDPGSRPLVIKVAPDHVTTVSILDSTGAPWPIEDISWAGDFELLQPQAGGNIFRITPLANFTYGNMSMKLLELDTPITFTLKTNRESVYYRLDARVPETGPNAEVPLIDGGITLVSGDSTISAFLDGVIPENAERLTVSGVDGRTRAYRYGSMTYIRTPLTLLSPGWTGSVSSADGMNVYVLADAPVLLLSDKGRVVRAHLKKEDEER